MEESVIDSYATRNIIYEPPYAKRNEQHKHTTHAEMTEEASPRLDISCTRPLGEHVMHEGPLVGDAVQQLGRQRVAELTREVEATGN